MMDSKTSNIGIHKVRSFSFFYEFYMYAILKIEMLYHNENSKAFMDILNEISYFLLDSTILEMKIMI